MLTCSHGYPVVSTRANPCDVTRRRSARAKILQLRCGAGKSDVSVALAQKESRENEQQVVGIKGSSKHIYAVAMAIQFAVMPIISSHFITPGIDKTGVVVVTEFVKIGISVLALGLGETQQSRQAMLNSWSLGNSAIVAAVPALLYAANNVLTQRGYALLDAVSFNVVNQTKTLFAVFWLWVIMGQEQSLVQILSLVLLVIAPAVLMAPPLLGNGTPNPVEALKVPGVSSKGLTVVLSASFISGLAAALTQRSLSGANAARNSLVFSAELAVWGIMFLLPSLIMQIIRGKNLLANWRLHTLLPVFVNAAGGITVGLVVKHSGNVAKGFALIVGLVFTGFLKWLIQGQPLRSNDFLAAALVSISIYLHASFPRRRTHMPETKESERT